MSAPIPPRVPSAPPAPTRHCPACARGHYVAVRFCPFCGAAQAPAPEEPPPEPGEAAGRFFLLETPAPVPAQAFDPGPAQASVHLPADPHPPAPPRSRASPPPPATAPAPAPPRRGAGRARPALLASGILAAGIAATALLGRGPRLPEPARIGVGPAWTGVALEPLRAAPRLRLTADAPFSLRLDGERVQRVGAGGRAVVRPRGLRALELRAARGRATVLLTPAE